MVKQKYGIKPYLIVFRELLSKSLISYMYFKINALNGKVERRKIYATR